MSSLRWCRIAFGVALVLAMSYGAGAAEPPASLSPTLDQGFLLLYDLNFEGAHQVFASFQQSHPDDPLAPACDAAGLLFSELDRLGVLEYQFFENDHNFQSHKKLAPDPAVRDRLNAALDAAEQRAKIRLASNPKDRDALFAMTLSTGLRSDYEALIEKRNLASLHDTRQAADWAQQLLAVDPTCYDAHLASGVSQYIIGSMAAPVRWILRLGGLPGDKAAGIAELRLTAQKGYYLAPFARILLAIAYVRDKDMAQARQVLAGLRDQFPRNPLFAREIARLDATGFDSSPHR